MAWVLVVDDDQATCETLRLLLEDHGYTVAEAPDGQAALEMLRSTPYHAIILFDLLMPILDGRELLRAVKQEPRLAERHAYILMTADHQSLREIQRQPDDGVHVSFVQKPFDVDALLRLVKQQEARLPSGK